MNCPWCNSERLMIVNEATANFDDYPHGKDVVFVAYVKCRSCGATGPKIHSIDRWVINDMAVKAWNHLFEKRDEEQ